MLILLDLYITFFILGATSFGGGYAMLPALQRTVAQKKGWATEEELVDYFAIGQCTPGIIAVNVSTFVGMKYKGVMGAITATLGLVSPCIIIIGIISTIFRSISSSLFFTHGFNGIKACVAVLIGGSAYTLMQKAIIDKTTGRIFYVVFTAMMIGNLFPDLPDFMGIITSPVSLIIFAGICGYLFYPKDK